MEARGHINATEVVKVHQPTATTGSGKDWLIADESGERAEMREGSLVADDVKEALGKDAEGFFEATWSAQGWKIGARLSNQKW